MGIFSTIVAILSGKTGKSAQLSSENSGVAKTPEKTATVSAEREESINYIMQNSNGMLSHRDAGRFVDVLLTYKSQGKAKAIEAFYDFIDETISLYSDNPGLFIMINGFCSGALKSNGIINETEATKISQFISERTAKWLDETRAKERHS